MISQSVRVSSAENNPQEINEDDYARVDYYGRYQYIFKKYNITREFVEECVVAEALGKKVDHPARGVFKEAMFESISNMVHMLCNRYATSCEEEADDLAQECFIRIIKSISKFNPKMGSFTHWCWYACKSQLNAEWRSGHRANSTRDKIFLTNDECAMPAPASMDSLRLDITNVVKELVSKYPKKKKMIHAMFGGDPEEGAIVLPSKINMRDVANRAGTFPADVSHFYCNKVRPLFKLRFS